MNENEITLGSLFDGIGAIPFAASFFGIKTVWASEILPNAISITKRHFPHITQLGDITKLHGGEIPPVDCISFGSPCQSWSVAGTRTGFEGKSGLFMEAIRIIREMRCATHGKSPKLALFENVPGLLSCGAGGRNNYKAVLEAFCEAEIPMPKSGRWANSGMVRGRGINLAWVVKDASKHFRVPQRRRRLFLVCDFTGSSQRAAQILFVTQSLSGYFTARASEGERNAANIEGRAGSAGLVGGSKPVTTEAHSHANTGAIDSPAPAVAAYPDISGTMCASGAGLSRPAGMANETDLCVVYCLQGSMIGRKQENDSQGGGNNEDTCFTLPSADRHAVAAVDCRNYNENDIIGTLQSKSSGGYSLNYQNLIRTGYVVRRLTPIECERLMSLPDGYTEYGHDWRLISDSARYQLLGNSIVVNVLAYIMQNIAEAMKVNEGNIHLQDERRTIYEDL